MRAYVTFCKAMQMQQRGEHAAALEAFQEVHALDPQSSAPLYHIGYSLYRLGESDKAIEYLKRSLKLRPGVGRVHETLAFTYAALGRRAEALRELEAAARAKVRPRNHEALVRRIASIYERQADWETATDWLRFALECGYRGRETCLKLGSLLLREERWDEALDSLRRALACTAVTKAAARDVRQVFASLPDERLGAALKHYGASTTLVRDAGTHEVIAMAYLAAGRPAEAMAEIRRAARAAATRRGDGTDLVTVYVGLFEELGSAAAAR
ncbi:tetratricopeptide repeat protein [Planctomycetota bacterium]